MFQKEKNMEFKQRRVEFTSSDAHVYTIEIVCFSMTYWYLTFWKHGIIFRYLSVDFKSDFKFQNSISYLLLTEIH